MIKHLPGNNVEAEQDRLVFVFNQSVFCVSVKWHIVVTLPYDYIAMKDCNNA